MTKFTQEEFDSSGGKPQNKLPEGEYLCRIQNALMGGKSTPAFLYEMVVVGGEYGGTRVDHQISTSPNARGVLCGWLKACGINGLTSRDVDELAETVGKKVIVRLVEDEYNGNKFKRVKGWKLAPVEAAPKVEAAVQDLSKKPEAPEEPINAPV
jgi:hypothetical protein